MVAWGGIEKSSARRATAHFSNSSCLQGTRWGTPELGYGDPNSWHHTSDTGPPNYIIHRSLEHANPRDTTANMSPNQRGPQQVVANWFYGDKSTDTLDPVGNSPAGGQRVRCVWGANVAGAFASLGRPGGTGLGKDAEDLFDPATNRYRRRNIWNSTTTQGAMHLIQGANTLSAEIEFAG